MLFDSHVVTDFCHQVSGEIPDLIMTYGPFGQDKACSTVKCDPPEQVAGILKFMKRPASKDISKSTLV